MLKTTKMNSIILVLVAIFVAIGLNSCDNDTTYYDPNSKIKEYQQIFENMKGNYSGSYTTPLNTSKVVKYTIDSQANVNVPNFPMETVLAKLCGSDYEYAELSGNALNLSCPIDSVGYSSGFLTFKTKNDLTSNILNFSYTYQKVKHVGYMYVTVKGIYNPLQRTISTNFIVTDLILDNKDLSSKYCPLDNIVEAERQ